MDFEQKENRAERWGAVQSVISSW